MGHYRRRSKPAQAKGIPGMKHGRSRGLYAITPQRYPDREGLLRDCAAALSGGACRLQFRDKSDDGRWRLQTARELLGLCREFSVPFIINDDIGLAGQIEADGVHLGRDDAEVAAARAVLGERAQIGVSCYNRLDRGAEALRQGAGYLAFGSMFASGSKPQAVHCPLDTLRQARSFGLPLVAIGGITAENGASVIAAGADFLAVIGAVFEAPDVQAAAERLSGLWPQDER